MTAARDGLYLDALAGAGHRDDVDHELGLVLDVHPQRIVATARAAPAPAPAPGAGSDCAVAANPAFADRAARACMAGSSTAGTTGHARIGRPPPTGRVGAAREHQREHRVTRCAHDHVVELEQRKPPRSTSG